MADILAKVLKLISLADSPHEEEARTSAFLAVKLIRQHKLVISNPGFGSSGSSVRDTVRINVEDLRDDIEDLRRRAEKRASAEPSKRSRAAYSPMGRYQRWDGTIAFKIKTDFPGKCMACGASFSANELVWWMPDRRRCVHDGCAIDWDKPAEKEKPSSPPQSSFSYDTFEVKFSVNGEPVNFADFRVDGTGFGDPKRPFDDVDRQSRRYRRR